MRNLKKVLSLALAMVMLLGMMVVGASAADDYLADVPAESKEAMAVMNAIEVIQGGDKGADPDGNLTRAMAARILCSMVSPNSSKIVANETRFADVNNNAKWAIPFVAYCDQVGLISGDGNGKFNPNGNVKYAEFATMLVRALGYDAKNEKFGDTSDGNKWYTNALRVATRAGVAITAAPDHELTRAEAAQMAFQTLTASLVEYKGMNVTAGDVHISSPATARMHNLTDVGKTTTYDLKTVTATTPIRFCEEYFPYLELSSTEEDNFGHTAAVWMYRKAEIDGSTTTLKADITITGKVTTSVPDWAKIKGLSKAANAELFINGDTSTAVPANGEAIRPLTGNGRLVEIYLSEANLNKFDKIVITDTALAEVTKVNDSDSTISVKLVKSAITDGNVVLNTKKGYGEDFKVGDLVLVQGYSTADVKLNAKTTITSVTAPTVVDGFATIKQYSDKDEAKYIKVDGEDYYDAYGVMTDYTLDQFNLNTEFNSILYLDQYGNIMKSIQGKDPKAVQDKLIAVSEAYSTLTDGKIVTMIKGVISNGETVTWPVDHTIDEAKACVNTIKLWSKNTSTNQYHLNAITGDKTALGTNDEKNNDKHLYKTYAAGETESFKSNDVFGKVGTRVMYSDTVRFIFVDKEGDNPEGVVVVNGRQSYELPTTASTKIVAEALNTKGEITAVFLAAKPDVADISEIIFVSSRYREWDEVITRADGSKVQYYGYTAYTSDGQPIDKFLGTEDNMDHGTGYFYIADKNADGAYKPTRRAMLNNHTIVAGDLQKANGNTGDAFTLKTTVGTATIAKDKILEFIGKSNTPVKDLTSAKLYIDKIPELNGAKNNEYDVTIAVIFNDTDAVSQYDAAVKVKEAKTVFVTKIVKSTSSSNTTPSGVPSEGMGGYEVYKTDVNTSTKLRQMLDQYGTVRVLEDGTAFTTDIFIPAGKTLIIEDNVTSANITMGENTALVVDGALTLTKGTTSTQTIKAGTLNIGSGGSAVAFAGPVAVSNDMAVGKNTTLSGNVTVGGNLGVATSVALTVSGTTAVTGGMTLGQSANLTVSGSATVGGLTAPSAPVVVNVTGDMTIGDEKVTGTTPIANVTFNVTKANSLHIYFPVAGTTTITVGNSIDPENNGRVKITGKMEGKFVDHNVISATVTETPKQEIATIAGEVVLNTASKVETAQFIPTKLEVTAVAGGTSTGAEITMTQGTANSNVNFKNPDTTEVPETITPTTVTIGNTASTDLSSYTPQSKGNVTVADSTVDDSAYEAVATIGTETEVKGTLAEVWSKIGDAETATITLQNDVTLNAAASSHGLTVAAGKTITLNMNGKSITGTVATSGKALIDVAGTLNVTGGSITATQAEGNARFAYAVMVEQNGIASFNGTGIEGVGAIFVSGAASGASDTTALTLTNCNVVSKNSNASAILTNGTNHSKVVITVAGGTINSEGAGLYLAASMVETTLNNVAVTSARSGVAMHSSKLTVNGGSIKVTGAAETGASRNGSIAPDGSAIFIDVNAAYTLDGMELVLTGTPTLTGATGRYKVAVIGAEGGLTFTGSTALGEGYHDYRTPPVTPVDTGEGSST